MNRIRAELPHVPIVALTATATDQVEVDIIGNLALRNPFMVRTTFNRTNLFYSVYSQQGMQKDLTKKLFTTMGYRIPSNTGTATNSTNTNQPIDLSSDQPVPSLLPSCIIYCITKAETEAVAAHITSLGIECKVGFFPIYCMRPCMVSLSFHYMFWCVSVGLSCWSISQTAQTSTSRFHIRSHFLRISHRCIRHG